MGKYSDGKVNTFASVFPTSKPKFVFIVMFDDPQKSKDYYYKYRHRDGGWRGTLKNSAGWTSVEVVGKIIDKIFPILVKNSFFFPLKFIFTIGSDNEISRPSNEFFSNLGYS